MLSKKPRTELNRLVLVNSLLVPICPAITFHIFNLSYHVQSVLKMLSEWGVGVIYLALESPCTFAQINFYRVRAFPHI